MLRSVTVHNFVHFLEHQRVEFCDGTNFLIGENSAGKSATLELVRRCLSNKISTTTTSVVDKKETAYAVCHFEIPPDYATYPILDAEKNKPTDVIAGMFVENRTTCSYQNKTDNQYDNYKLFCQISNGNPYRLYVQHYKGFHGCSTDQLQMYSCKSLLCDDLTYTIKRILTVGEEKDVIDFIDTIRDRMAEMKETIQCEGVDAVYKWLENGYVSVLPMRSIGPLQWTRSDKNKQEYMNENYTTACNRAEIITQLLGSDKIDKELEEKYDRNLVFPYKFEKTKDEIRVINMELSNSSTKPLLKTPEGFVEAKQMTLILAHKELYTITYEEPDRGMHPHMIKKMRDLVLRNVKGKTVIVVSHNPAITNQWTMERTHVCSKTRHKSGEISHYICKVPSGFNRYGRLDEMKSLLFSSRILFVEGMIDKIILEAIFSLLINNATIRERNNISFELTQYLLGTDILELSTADEGNKKKEFCDNLNKKNYVLYDADVFKDRTPMHKGSTSKKDPSSQNVQTEHIGWRVNGEHKGVKFKENFKDQDEFIKEENFSKFEKACEEENIFCWKNGAIEYRIIEVLDKVDSCDQDTFSLISKLASLKTEETISKLETSVDPDKEKKLKHAKESANVIRNAVKEYKETEGKSKTNQKKEIIDGLKRSLSLADHLDIELLVKKIIRYSPEIDRLINFLKRQMRNVDFDCKPKRKASITSELLNLSSEKKPCRSPEENYHSYEASEMAVDETYQSEETHTGQSQELLDLSLDDM